MEGLSMVISKKLLLFVFSLFVTHCSFSMKNSNGGLPEEDTPEEDTPEEDTKELERLFNQFIIKDEEEILHFAALRGDLVFIKRIFQENKYFFNKNINLQKGDKKITPLFFAVISGNIQCIEFLLEHGAELNHVSYDGSNVIHYAVKENRYDLIPFFHKKNKKLIHGYDNRGRTPLHIAAMTNSLDCFKVLLKMGAQLNVLDEYGSSCMHLAIAHGARDVLSYFIDTYEKKVETIDKKGNTPLHYAAIKNNLPSFTLLLEKKASLNTPNIYGDFCLHLAAYYGSSDILRYLIDECNLSVDTLDCTDNLRPLQCAVITNELDSFKFLLEKNAKIDVVDKNGNNVVHSAISSGNTDIIKFIQSDYSEFFNKSLQLKNYDDHIPLDVMKYDCIEKIAENDIKLFFDLFCQVAKSDSKSLNTFKDVIKKLLNKDQNFAEKFILMKNANGNTILHLACLFNHPDIIECIKEKKLERLYELLCIKNNFDITPLQLAYNRGHQDIIILIENIIELILGKNPNVFFKPFCDIKNNDYKNYHTSIKLIAENNSQLFKKILDSVNPCGASLLYLACGFGYKNIVELIGNTIEETAFFELLKKQDKNGNTPLHLVCRYDYVDILKFISNKIPNDLKNLLSIKNSNNNTPLHLAYYKRKKAII